MTTSGHSLERRLFLGSVAAVTATIVVGGVIVHRAAGARMEASGEANLASLLDTTSLRACGEALRAERAGDVVLPSMGNDSIDRHEWLIRAVGPHTEVSRTLEFPIEDPAWIEVADERKSPVTFTTVLGDDGVRYRIASLVLTPYDELPPEKRGPRQRGGGAAGGPGGGNDRERPWERDARDGRDRDGRDRDGRDRDGRDRDGRDRDQRDRLDDRDGPPWGRIGSPFLRDGRFEVHAAIPIEEEETALRELARLLGLVGLGSTALAALMMRVVVRTGLKPLGSLSQQVAKINEERLTQTVAMPGAPREIQPLVGALEAARSRLADAFARERRFTADAAHELRTPIAGLRATLEVVLRRERSQEELRESSEQCLEIALSMQDTVETLLLLAREGTATEERTEVDFGDALIRAFEAEASTREDRGVRVEVDADEDAVGLTVPALAQRITSNLASNALAYASAHTKVSAQAWRVGGDVQVIVVNEADDLPDDVAERAAEPFWRADTSRTDHGAHAGLGLALVRSCAEALGGSLKIESKNGTFKATVTVPA